MTILTFHWQGLGYLGGPVRYRKSFDDATAAADFRERVMEGRVPEARYRVRTDDGVLRRLGTSDSCYTAEIVEQRKAVA